MFVFHKTYTFTLPCNQYPQDSTLDICDWLRTVNLSLRLAVDLLFETQFLNKSSILVTESASVIG